MVYISVGLRNKFKRENSKYKMKLTLVILLEIYCYFYCFSLINNHTLIIYAQISYNRKFYSISPEASFSSISNEKITLLFNLCIWR